MDEATGDHSGPDPWLQRASDADREAYVAALQGAYAEGRLTRDEYDERMSAAYLATTYGDLAALVRDLPVTGLPVPVMTSAELSVNAAGDVLPASPSAPAIVACLSSVERRGSWAVRTEQGATAVLGSVVLDLTAARLPGPRVTIQAVAVLGDVRIIVPAGLRLDVAGTGVMGEFSGLPMSGEPGAPVVTVKGAAVLGRVLVEVVGTGHSAG